MHWRHSSIMCRVGRYNVSISLSMSLQWCCRYQTQQLLGLNSKWALTRLTKLQGEYWRIFFVFPPWIFSSLSSQICSGRTGHILQPEWHAHKQADRTHDRRLLRVRGRHGYLVVPLLQINSWRCCILWGGPPGHPSWEGGTCLALWWGWAA